MEEVQGGVSGEGAVGFLGIVPDEPGGELPVESGKVVGEMLVGLDEAIPQGAVEALVSPVLLGAGGEDEEAAQPQTVGQAVKISLEFSPVVGEQGEDGDGQDQQQPAQELGGALGVALGERHGESQARVVIHCGEQKQPGSAPHRPDFHRIQGDQVAGVPDGHSLGQAALVVAAPLARLDPSAAIQVYPRAGPHAVGRVGDQPSDGGNRQRRQPAFARKRVQRRLDRLLARVQMQPISPKSANKLHLPPVGFPPAPPPAASAATVAQKRLPPGPCQLAPAAQRPTAHFKRIARRRVPMTAGKRQNLSLFLVASAHFFSPNPPLPGDAVQSLQFIRNADDFHHSAPRRDASTRGHLFLSSDSFCCGGGVSKQPAQGRPKLHPCPSRSVLFSGIPAPLIRE